MTLPTIHNLITGDVPAGIPECVISLGRCFSRAHLLIESAWNDAEQNTTGGGVDALLVEAEAVLNQAARILRRLLDEAGQAAPVDEASQLQSLADYYDFSFRRVIALAFTRADGEAREHAQLLWSEFSNDVELMDRYRDRETSLIAEGLPASTLVTKELQSLESQVRVRVEATNVPPTQAQPLNLLVLGNRIERLLLPGTRGAANSISDEMPRELSAQLVIIDDRGKLREQVAAAFQSYRAADDSTHPAIVWHAVAIERVIAWRVGPQLAPSADDNRSILAKIKALHRDNPRVAKMSDAEFDQIAALIPPINEPHPDLWVEPRAEMDSSKETTRRSLRDDRSARRGKRSADETVGIDEMRRIFRCPAAKQYRYFKPSFIFEQNSIEEREGLLYYGKWSEADFHRPPAV